MKQIALLTILVTAAALWGAHPEFASDVTGDKKPWTNENFPDISVDRGNFTFAVVPDRTGGARQGVFKAAMHKINSLCPDFVMCVGDLVEGTDAKNPSREDIDGQWKELRAKTAILKMPFFYTVGNHDINRNNPHTDRRFSISQAAWQDNFGKRTYYSFTYRNALFIMLNTMEDGDKSNSPSPISTAQLQWVQETLKKHSAVRWTFIFMHHPKFATREFRQIEKLLAGKNYTVFAGDWHRYTKFSRYGRNYYVLSTCGGGIPREGKKRIPAHRGPEYGEMDHITWVTLTPSGPVVANILVDGIIADDVATQNSIKVPVRRKLDAPVNTGK